MLFLQNQVRSNLRGQDNTKVKTAAPSKVEVSVSKSMFAIEDEDDAKTPSSAPVESDNDADVDADDDKFEDARDAVSDRIDQWFRNKNTEDLGDSLESQSQEIKLRCQPIFVTEVIRKGFGRPSAEMVKTFDDVTECIGQLFSMKKLSLDDLNKGLNRLLDVDVMQGELDELHNAHEFLAKLIASLATDARIKLKLDFLKGEHTKALLELTSKGSPCFKDFLRKLLGDLKASQGASATDFITFPLSAFFLNSSGKPSKGELQNFLKESSLDEFAVLD